MYLGASSPEELDSLLEDAFVLGDRDALAKLFETDAVLLAADRALEARGAREIARVTSEMCDRCYTYLSDPIRVLQARDTTLIVADRAVNVMRRGTDGRWRYAIALLGTEQTISARNDNRARTPAAHPPRPTRGANHDQHR